jgi:hypothetical protein
MFRVSPPGVTTFGMTCRGTLANTPQTGLQNPAAAGIRLHLSNAPVAAPALFLLGSSRDRFGSLLLPHPVDSLGFPGCLLLVAPEIPIVATTGTTGLDAGHAYLDLNLPLAPDGKGTLGLYGQWLVLGFGTNAPGGWTQAMSWRH